MQTQQLKNRRRDSGNAVLELAMVLPLLILMSMGGSEVGRMLSHAVTVANAAAAGAFYGAQNNLMAGDSSGMRHMAKGDGSSIEELSITADRFCDCPDAPGEPVDCSTGSCSSYGSPRAFIRTRVRETFEPLIRYPGVPSTFPIGGDAYMRVQ